VDILVNDYRYNIKQTELPYLKVKTENKYSSFDEDEIMLFPFLHRTAETCWIWRRKFIVSLLSTLGGGEHPASRPIRFTPERTAPPPVPGGCDAWFLSGRFRTL
jgi:hypothetical protein